MPSKASRLSTKSFVTTKKTKIFLINFGTPLVAWEDLKSYGYIMIHMCREAHCGRAQFTAETALVQDWTTCAQGGSEEGEHPRGQY